MLRVAELGLIALICLLIIAEVLVPLARGTPFFPLISGRSTRQLVRRLKRANQAAEEEDIKQEIAIREPRDDDKTGILTKPLRRGKDPQP